MNKKGFKLSDKEETRSLKIILFQLECKKSHLFRIFITLEFMTIRAMTSLKFTVILYLKKNFTL